MKRLFLIIFIIFNTIGFSQEVECNDLINYIKEKGTKISEVSSVELLNSSWLNEVKGYKINNNYAVIAEIKKDNIGLTVKEYVFCGITKSEWDGFYYGLYDIGSSYGERFHKYIIKKQCNCN